MVGSAIMRNLKNQAYTNIIGKDIDKLDLTSQADVKNYFEKKNLIM